VYPVSNGGTLSGTDTVCYGFNGGNIILANNVGNIIRWEKSTNNFATYTVLTGTGNPQTYSNLISTTYYRVQVQNGSCAPVYSPIVEVTVNPNSVGGTISGSDTVCVSSNAGVLRLSGYLGTVVQWETSTDNFTSTTVPVSNTTDTIAYNNLSVTTYFRAQIQNIGCPITYPSPAMIKVDPVSVPGTLTAPAVVCASSNTGVIKLAGYSGTILQWDTSYNNFSTYDTIVNTTDSIEYHNLRHTTFYRALVKSGVCASAYSNVTAVTVNPASVGGTIIGAKNICIDANAGTLVLTGDTGVVLKWQTSPNNFATYTDIANVSHNFSFNSLTTPLSVRAEVQYSPCPPVYSDVFTFIINPSTVAGMITGNTVVKKGENSGPLTLINFTGGVQEWQYSEDTATGWTSLPITSNVYEFINLDTTIYVKARVKSGNCNDEWSAVFILQVSTESNTVLKVYPTISPNADQINDEWIIDNIALYPSNQVKIFNRWGDVVYEARGYDNTSKVWRGQSNTHFTVLGQDLPEGTYFYVIDPGNGKAEFSGYVVLNR
jgi:gliding motility-associated-like protein